MSGCAIRQWASLHLGQHLSGTRGGLCAHSARSQARVVGAAASQVWQSESPTSQPCGLGDIFLLSVQGLCGVRENPGIVGVGLNSARLVC